MLRPLLIATLLAVTMLTALPSGAAAFGGQERVDRVERLMIKLVNDERRRFGLAPLLASLQLNRSADYHSRDMLRSDYFSHTSRDGRSMKARISGFTRKHRLAETLAYESGRGAHGLAGRIVRSWMNSPGHRAALLSPLYECIGMARRSGQLGSQSATVVTANLSSRR